MEPFVFMHPREHVEEIQAAYDRFMAQADLYAEQPSQIDKDFLRLIYDLSHVVRFHPFAKDFLDKCLSFLQTYPESLPSQVRISLVQAIVVLHNHDVIDTVSLIDHFIPLFRLNDKNVRRTIYGHLFNRLPFKQTLEIKKTLQKYVYHDDSRVSFKVLKLIIDIFHKENKPDTKTINFIARCIEIKNTRLLNAIVSFFLDPYVVKTDAADEDELEEMRTRAEHILQVNPKSKKNEAKLKKVKKMRAAIPQDPVQVIQCLNDPHKFIIKLYSLLAQPENVKLFKQRENQLRAMELISKIMIQFQLDFDQFFTWSLRFVRPNYEDITKLLSILASAVHQSTNTDIVYELIKTIADRFVVEHLDEEIIIIGLNTIREICAKNPYGMTPELLGDLCAYKKESIKGVVMAARGIISIFREQRPDILPKADRARYKDEKEEAPAQDTVLDSVLEIAMTRPLTDEEINKIKEGRDVVGEIGEIDEQDIITGSKVRRATKEEMIQLAKEGKPDKHAYRSKKEDKTAGFTNKEKSKFKPFMLTRYRSDSNLSKNRGLSAVQKGKKAKENKIKQLKNR
jgi:protein SDA1